MNASSGFSIGSYRPVHHYRPLDESRAPWSHNIGQGSNDSVPAACFAGLFADLVGEVGHRKFTLPDKRSEGDC